MPFAGFEDWDECHDKMLSEGHDDESANKICGKLKSEHEGNPSKTQDSLALDLIIKHIKSRQKEDLGLSMDKILKEAFRKFKHSNDMNFDTKPRFYCNKCQGYHFFDSDLGKKHLSKAQNINKNIVSLTNQINHIEEYLSKESEYDRFNFDPDYSKLGLSYTRNLLSKLKEIRAERLKHDMTLDYPVEGYTRTSSKGLEHEVRTHTRGEDKNIIQDEELSSRIKKQQEQEARHKEASEKRQQEKVKVKVYKIKSEEDYFTQCEECGRQLKHALITDHGTIGFRCYLKLIGVPSRKQNLNIEDLPKETFEGVAENIIDDIKSLTPTDFRELLQDWMGNVSNIEWAIHDSPITIQYKEKGDYNKAQTIELLRRGSSLLARRLNVPYSVMKKALESEAMNTFWKKSRGSFTEPKLIIGTEQTPKQKIESLEKERDNLFIKIKEAKQKFEETRDKYWLRHYNELKETQREILNDINTLLQNPKNDMTEDVAGKVGRPRLRGLKTGTPGAMISGAKRTTVGQSLLKTIGPEAFEIPNIESITIPYTMINTETGAIVKGELVENLAENIAEMVPVSSSNVRAAGQFKNELLVQFYPAKNIPQRTYRYKFETPEMAREAKQSLISSGSPGRWVWQHLRGHTAGEPVTPSKLGPSLQPPGQGIPTIGGTSASLAPYDISNRTPVGRVGGFDDAVKKLKRLTSNPTTQPATGSRVEEILNTRKLFREMGFNQLMGTRLPKLDFVSTPLIVDSKKTDMTYDKRTLLKDIPVDPKIAEESFGARSNRSKAQDKSRRAATVYPSPNEKWIRHPNLTDVEGIDTPGGSATTAEVPKSSLTSQEIANFQYDDEKMQKLIENEQIGFRRLLETQIKADKEYIEIIERGIKQENEKIATAPLVYTRKLAQLNLEDYKKQLSQTKRSIADREAQLKYDLPKKFQLGSLNITPNSPNQEENIKFIKHVQEEYELIPARFRDPITSAPIYFYDSVNGHEAVERLDSMTGGVCIVRETPQMAGKLIYHHPEIVIASKIGMREEYIKLGGSVLGHEKGHEAYFNIFNNYPEYIEEFNNLVKYKQGDYERLPQGWPGKPKELFADYFMEWTTGKRWKALRNHDRPYTEILPELIPVFEKMFGPPRAKWVYDMMMDIIKEGYWIRIAYEEEIDGGFAFVDSILKVPEDISYDEAQELIDSDKAVEIERDSTNDMGTSQEEGRWITRGFGTKARHIWIPKVKAVLIPSKEPAMVWKELYHPEYHKGYYTQEDYDEMKPGHRKIHRKFKVARDVPLSGEHGAGITLGYLETHFVEMPLKFIQAIKEIRIYNNITDDPWLEYKKFTVPESYQKIGLTRTYHSIDGVYFPGSNTIVLGKTASLHTMYHEIGHVIWHTLPDVDKTRLFRIFDDLQQELRRANEDYEANDIHELFAENFAHYMIIRRLHKTFEDYKKHRYKIATLDHPRIKRYFTDVMEKYED